MKKQEFALNAVAKLGDKMNDKLTPSYVYDYACSVYDKVCESVIKEETLEGFVSGVLANYESTFEGKEVKEVEDDK